MPTQIVEAINSELIVGGKPSSPGKPTLKFDPDNSDPDIVTIRWDPPLFDGGSKITGYLVEHRRTGSPHWVKASPIKVRQTQLTVSGLEPGWRYQFRVTAENAIGYSDPSPLSEPLAIFVHRSAAIAPYFITELNDIIALENEKVEFNVTFEGVPNPKISWYRDGLEIFSNRCQKISTEANTSTYIIYEAAISDESEIKCSATNRVGYAVTKAYLKVEAPPTIRLPRQYDEGLIFEEGETIRLKVSVVGQPQPLINWYFNGERISLSSRYDMEYADKTAILKIKDAQRSDRGDYQIQAVNELGEDVVSILVTIANKPQPPNKISVNGIFGRSVTLTWTKPEDDGGCKIGSYIIEYYKTGWNVWLKAATCRQLTTTLDNLIEGSQYRFRVKAENPYGVSEPSSETEPIFIPDPKRGLYEAPKTAHSTESYISEFCDTSLRLINQSISHSSELLERDKLQVPIKPKRKYKSKKIQDESKPEPEYQFHQEQETETFNIFRNSPSPQPSSNMDDTSRTSSELMLVLVPSSEDVPNNTGSLNLDIFSSKHFSNFSVPPPMSLSAPELGSEMLFFKPLQRNCVSSTEILHESTIARFYDDLQKEENLKTLREKLKENMNKNAQKPVSSLNQNLFNHDAISNKELGPEIVDDLRKISQNDINDLTPTIQIHEIQNSPRIKPKKTPLPENQSSDAAKSSPEFNQGRYSPTSGTFHYPDLFMESLTKSPKFKPTANSLSELVNEVISKKPIPIDPYLIESRNSIPEIKLTDEKDINYNTPLEEKLYPSSSSLNEYLSNSSQYSISDDKIDHSNSSTNESEDQNEWDYDDTETDDSEDETDDYEDGDEENDTYHPEMVLSFERALEISNPKYRSVSPTTNLFLDTDSKFGLNYFNKNYQDSDDTNSSDRRATTEKPPKSILKCHRFSEKEESKQPPTSSVTTRIPQKKQVRIEEPKKMEPKKLTEEYDTSVIINHYSDIVKQYGHMQKPFPKVYLTYDELKAAAQIEEELLPEKVAKENEYLKEDEECESHSSEKLALNSVNNEVEKVKTKVHFFFDLFLDIVMFILACWLYCFKDERLAIPVIILMIYRQVYDKIRNKIPEFKIWNRKKS